MLPSVEERFTKIAKLAANARPEYGFAAKALNIYPYEDKLEIRWYKDKKGIKMYTVVCGPCGGNRLYTWGNGLRCRKCNTFHAYQAFQKIQERVWKLTKFNDGAVEEIIQPKPQPQNVLIDYRRNKIISLAGMDQKQKNERITRYLTTGL